MDKLVLAAPALMVVLMARLGVARAFVYGYLPLLLLVPAYLTMDGPGIPPLAFNTAAMLPFLLLPRFWRSAVHDLHLLDGLLYLFLGLVCLSELLHNSFSSSRQVLFLNLLTLWAPYVMMRHVVLSARLERDIMRVAAVCLALVAVYGLYTFRFGVNHFLVLRGMWPFYTPLPGLAVWPRWGFFRASGPFMHPIMAGIVFGFVLPAAFWLWRSKALKPNWFGLMLLGCLSVGLVTTLSRGPFMGAVVAVGLYLMGESARRAVWFSALGVLLLFLSVPTAFETADYFDATRTTAASAEQETALYRRDLILNYVEVIKRRPWLGYSFLKVPVVGDQSSIDNAYLLLALQWGVPATACILGLLLGSIALAVRHGVRDDLDPGTRGGLWALCGAMVGCLISAGTVALLPPTMTLLMLWAGWASALGLRLTRPAEAGADGEEPAAAPQKPRFQLNIL